MNKIEQNIMFGTQKPSLTLLNNMLFCLLLCGLTGEISCLKSVNLIKFFSGELQKFFTVFYGWIGIWSLVELCNSILFSSFAS
jgi:hypothetical protein